MSPLINGNMIFPQRQLKALFLPAYNLFFL